MCPGVGDIVMVKDVILIDSSLESGRASKRKKESYKTLRVAKEKVRLQEPKSRQV